MINSSVQKAHQWIVDESQKKPGWWAGQVAFAYAVLGIIGTLLSWGGGTDIFLMAMFFFVAPMLIWAANQEIGLKMLASSRNSKTVLVVCSLYQLGVFVSKSSPDRFLMFVSTSLLVSYFYFAACDNPKPKKRKEKMVLQAAGN